MLSIYSPKLPFYLYYTAQPIREDWVFCNSTLAVEEVWVETQQDFFLFLPIFCLDPKGYNHKYYPLVSLGQLSSSSYNIVCAWYHYIVQFWIGSKEYKAQPLYQLARSLVINRQWMPLVITLDECSKRT